MRAGTNEPPHVIIARLEGRNRRLTVKNKNRKKALRALNRAMEANFYRLGLAHVNATMAAGRIRELEEKVARLEARAELRVAGV